jgi:hypothetical protein
MMQPAAHEVIDVVAMRNRLVAAIRAVLVRAARLRSALHRIGGIDRDRVLVDMIVVHVVKMAVVEIVQVASVANRGMPAVRAMLMRMVGMVLLGAGGHDFPFFVWEPTGPHSIFSAAHRHPVPKKKKPFGLSQSYNANRIAPSFMKRLSFKSILQCYNRTGGQSTAH